MSVVLIPARDNRKAKTAPAGPAPVIITLGDVVFDIDLKFSEMAWLSDLRRVKLSKKYTKPLAAKSSRVAGRPTCVAPSVSANPAIECSQFSPYFVA